MSEHVIERPELQPPATRAMFGVLTLVLWTSYAYLLLPAFTLIAWYFGFTTVYDEMVMRSGWEALASLLGYYALIVLIMGVIQIGWASINWARFRGTRDRRRLRERQVDREVASMFAGSIEALPQWQSAKRLVVHHDEARPLIVSIEAA
jgi:biofilm PGA synthesis protein PgaD